MAGMPLWNCMQVTEKVVERGTLLWKACILSGSGFYEFLYSVIKSLKKIREIAEFIPNQLRFHEKNFC